MLRPVSCLLLLLGLTFTLAAGSRDHVFPISVAIAAPSGSVANVVDASAGMGFSIGYSYAVSKTLGLGMAGTWTQTPTHDSLQNDLTTYQLLATVRIRLFKHGWTPYAQGEGGVGSTSADTENSIISSLVPSLGDVTAAVAVRIGVLVPLGDQFDLDVHGRAGHTFLNDGLTHASLHVGCTYSPRF